MNTIPQQCKDLFDQFMKNEITQEEFDRKVNALKSKRTESMFSGRACDDINWDEEKGER